MGAPEGLAAAIGKAVPVGVILEGAEGSDGAWRRRSTAMMHGGDLEFALANRHQRMARPSARDIEHVYPPSRTVIKSTETVSTLMIGISTFAIGIEGAAVRFVPHMG